MFFFQVSLFSSSTVREPPACFTVTHPHLLQGLGQNIAALLLVDEDDDGRLEAVRQDLQQLLPAQHKEGNAQHAAVSVILGGRVGLPLTSSLPPT